MVTLIVKKIIICNKGGTEDDSIVNAKVTNEEDGGGDGYQDSEQMGRAKGTH